MGQTIGILGAGQLGRMLALAGYPLGYRMRCFDPVADSPSSHVCPQICGTYMDFSSASPLRTFAAGLDVVTWEFENVPVEAVRFISELVPTYPHVRALEVGQDRLHEKRFFEELGFDVHPYAPADNFAEFEAATVKIGFPCIAKTRRLGYDGKGQSIMRSTEDVANAWKTLGDGVHPCIVEQLIPFEAEASIIAVRSKRGDILFYPLTQNVHRGGILRVSVVPATSVSAELENEARLHIAAAMQRLEYVGVLAIEFFVAGGKLLANEMAPRVHNTGHWTIEGAVTSQFENHIRAISGLPLGSTQLRDAGSVMINVIGQKVDTESLAGVANAHIHDYGKDPKPGRKVGHITLCPVEAGWMQRKELSTYLQGV